MDVALRQRCHLGADGDRAVRGRGRHPAGVPQPVLRGGGALGLPLAARSEGIGLAGDLQVEEVAGTGERDQPRGAGGAVTRLRGLRAEPLGRLQQLGQRVLVLVHTVTHTC